MPYCMSAHTCGVVEHRAWQAGAGLVVGKDGGEEGEATEAAEMADGVRGVAALLRAVIPLHEGDVEVGKVHLIPHHGAHARLRLFHPHRLRWARN